MDSCFLLSGLERLSYTGLQYNSTRHRAILVRSVVISTIDNILRVKIMEAKADVHPLLVIAGVIGGVNLFGVVGLFLGPILLPLLMTYFETFRERYE